MKIDLPETLKQLGLPVALIALFAAILALVGVPLDKVLEICGGLAGVFALVALLINVLKWAGAVNDGTAGKWSAAINLVVLIAVAVIFKLYPSFDFAGVDAQIAEFARVAAILFTYIVQIVGTKQVHKAMTRGLNILAWSNTMRTQSVTG
jgi:hypothetical protein